MTEQTTSKKWAKYYIAELPLKDTLAGELWSLLRTNTTFAISFL